MRVTVLGATGGIGYAICEELVSRGHQVVAASRSVSSATAPAGTEPRPTDLFDPAATSAACADAEVIVMAASLPYTEWASRLPAMVDRAVDAAADADARLVMVDNLYSYGSPGTAITDTSPQSASTRKGQLRRDLGRRLLDVHARGHARITIGRFSDYYGPTGDNSLLCMLGVDRVLAGKRPQAFIDADQPHTFAYLPDAARAFATLVEQPQADGRSWILPAHAPITQREALRLISDAAGVRAAPRTITPAMLWVAGLFDPQLREAREQIPQFDRPYIAVGDDFEAAFGRLGTTPHPEAIAATVTRRRANHSAVAATSA